MRAYESGSRPAVIHAENAKDDKRSRCGVYRWKGEADPKRARGWDGTCLQCMAALSADRRHGGRVDVTGDVARRGE